MGNIGFEPMSTALEAAMLPATPISQVGLPRFELKCKRPKRPRIDQTTSQTQAGMKRFELLTYHSEGGHIVHAMLHAQSECVFVSVDGKNRLLFHTHFRVFLLYLISISLTYIRFF